MKIGLVAVLLWLAASPALARNQISEESPYQEMEQIMMLFYNHMDSIDKNIEAKLAAEKLIEEHPNNPWLYDLWATIEWNLIGLELEMKLEERRNITNIPPYRKRAERYHQMTAQGLQSAEQLLTTATTSTEQRQWLFAKAVLYFASGKIFIRFENGLRQSDEIGAKGVKELKKIIAQDPNFSPAFMYLGATRYQLSLQGLFQRLGIRLFSSSYSELKELDDDVFNKEKSVVWIEKAQQYGAPETWMRKNWLEATLALEGIYNRQRKDFNQPEELVFIEQKHLPLLELITQTLPENKKYTQKLEQLRDYLQKKKAG